MILCQQLNTFRRRRTGFKGIFRDLVGGANQEWLKAPSALEEAGDELARYAGYSVKSRVFYLHGKLGGTTGVISRPFADGSFLF